MPISFDRAAEYYDETRGYAPGVGERVGRALLEAAGATAASRILEMGVGTGRIALPIIRTGYSYTGIDISPLMLAKLRAALPEIPGAEGRVTLVAGDVTALPFADRSFDVVLTVHVYHLVDERARAIAEGVRVLARPGVILNGRDDSSDEVHREVIAAWLDAQRALGWTPDRDERDARQSVARDWERLGGAVDSFVGLEWEELRPPSRDLEMIERRLWSSTWAVPDEIYPEAARRLRAWAERRFGAELTTPVPRRRRFIIERARFA